MNLGKTYIPKEYESDIHDLWESRNAFAPSGKGETFSMVLPPPNANAGLHIGHALMFNIQDIIVRYQRMQGKDVLWLPGADHAGFETQVVYEKHLAAEGKSRFDFSREELYDQVYEFVAQNRGAFNDIFRRLGASVDWNHFTFTLDEKVVNTAYSTFKKMWDDGLIYRGERLVNYCTQHRTSFADIEVVYEDRTTPLYYMKYGPFELATTRPETKFGDTAVAVHPEDERYQQYVGKVIEVEGVNGPFEIRVLADEMVDREFGTGVVKITPAHDQNDWEVAQRHDLEAVRVINHDGTMNHKAGQFEGMPVAEARKAVAKAMKEKGLLIKVDEKYKNRVGVCYKCGTVIEPMLMDQWFIAMEKLAKPAIAALKKKEITFYPDQKRDQLIDYLENVRDWNISRQIAWGIPIPAFQNVDDPDDWIFNEQVDEEIIVVDGKKYRRDPDVFDTWFSSGHWPYVTVDGPDSDDFKRYYPNALMETGGDILYPWVSRMIVLGLYLTGEIPFKEVYLHGMVRGIDGKKMSKSIGNVVDPVPVLDEYGSDALRMGMIAGRSAGYSAAYAPAKVVAGRNFCNKIWNMARFVETMLDPASDFHSAPDSSNAASDDRISSSTASSDTPASEGAPPASASSKSGARSENTSRVLRKPGKPDIKAITPADHWMLSKIQHTADNVAKLLDEYRISEAYETVYHFVWDDVADWYIESSKHEINPGLLRYTLDSCLRIAHPFAPFVTETIWQTLDWTGDSLLVGQEWPKHHKFTKSHANEFEDIRTIVTEVRAIVSALKLRDVVLYYNNVPFLADHNELIAGLAKIQGVQEVEDGKGLFLTTTSHKCWLGVDRETIMDYSSQLQNSLQEAEKALEGYNKRLSNEAYVKKAPKKLVDETKAQAKEAEQVILNIRSQIDRFSLDS